MKRIVDALASALGLLVLSPLLGVVAALIWIQDRKTPFYVASRVGLNGAPFKMIKFRSMTVGADKSGVDSTGSNDPRITSIGRVIRRLKIDELPQLVNVLRGEMSLVGPRPNVEREVRIYTLEERRLLSVRPGITDIASLVFADEGDIIKEASDPDIAYNQLVRPGKNRLGLFYVENSRVFDDCRIIGLTLLSAVDKRRALDESAQLLSKWGASEDLIEIALRNEPLRPMPPPGAEHVVTTREIDPNQESRVFDLAVITEDWSTFASTQQRIAAGLRYRLSQRLTDGGNFLEVACGTGIGLDVVAEEAALAVGIDVVPKNVARCNERLSNSSAAVGDAVALPVSSDTFECAAFLEALYYVENQDQSIAEMARVLRPHGAALVSMPNPERAGFSPSPGSTHYPTPSELRTLMLGHFEEVEMFGAFPFQAKSGAAAALSEYARRALVGLRLMPSSIEARGRLKRLLQPGVRPLAEFSKEAIDIDELLVPLSESQVETGAEFTVVYAIAKLPK